MKGVHLIGISGKARSGKDYLGEHVLRPNGYVPFALSWHMKTTLVGRRYLTHEEAFGDKNPRVRRLLQEFGTEQGRDVYGEDVWIRTADSWLQLLRDEYGFNKVYIPDIRFVNEAEWIHGHGGKLVRIDGGGLADENAEHRSETELDEWTHWDVVVPSRSPVHELHKALRAGGVL